jgi:Sec7-like guanine-nucleotide exchange factor
LAEAVKLFNEKPKKGIELLIQKQQVRVSPRTYFCFDVRMELTRRPQIEREPAAVARWLFTTQGLDKDKLGDYLGEGYAFLSLCSLARYCCYIIASSMARLMTVHSDKFNVEVLREFVKQFDFTHLDFDIALRCVRLLSLSLLSSFSFSFCR